jgi:hypothetical protein
MRPSTAKTRTLSCTTSTHPGYVDGPGGLGKAMEIVQTAFEDIGIPAKTLGIDDAEPTQTVG